MIFEELPEIPKIWLDFLHSRLSALPAPSSMAAFLAQAATLRNQETRYEGLCGLLANAADLRSDRTLENLQLLRQQGAIAVVTNFSPDLFGGPVFQIWKCLTAVKVCEELSRHQLNAVPVCWIHTSVREHLPKWSIQLLDSESELRCLQLQNPGTKDFTPADFLPEDQIYNLLSRVEELGKGAFDPEILEILKASYSRDTTFAQASARLISALFKKWGMIVLNPHAPDLHAYINDTAAPFRAQGEKIRSFLRGRISEPASSGQLPDNSLPVWVVQSVMLPVAACVIGPDEAHSYLEMAPAFEALGLVQPKAWPQASVTVLDARSRRTLERYQLGLHQLYSGVQTITGSFMDAMPQKVSGNLLTLEREVQDRIAGLTALHPADSEFGKAAEDIKKKILYQMEKFRENFDAACKRKQETMSRQIRRARNSLAPNGRIQEKELAGIQLPLRYSRAVLLSLYEKLDIQNLEHQLISVD